VRENLQIQGLISYFAVRCQVNSNGIGDDNEPRLPRTRGRGGRETGVVSGSATGLVNHLSNLLDVINVVLS
jgi:hypothetical protein